MGSDSWQGTDAANEQAGLRIGIDLGGTKIEGIALARDGRELARRRITTPRDDYDRTVRAIAGLAAFLEQTANCGNTAGSSIGVGMPGSISPKSGLVQNANSTWLNGRPFDRDLTAALSRPVRCANDANCFALSESVDGAGAGAGSVFGVILGTGCGGGIVLGNRVVDGPRGIGGEWGHNPLPWASAGEQPGPACWCGRHGCMETWVSGPAMAADHARVTGVRRDAEAIAALAAAGDAAALATLERHASRLARGLAHIVNVIDPEIIVLGGGLSQLDHLYKRLPGMMVPFIFADDTVVTIARPKWGDAGGARGAAWLWD